MFACTTLRVHFTDSFSAALGHFLPLQGEFNFITEFCLGLKILTKWPDGRLSLLVVIATMTASRSPPHSANAHTGNLPPIVTPLTEDNKKPSRVRINIH